MSDKEDPKPKHLESQHGYCPNCKANLDGGYVVEYPVSQGYPWDKVIEYCSHYSGWTEHGLNNRWGRSIGLYSWEEDRTTGYQCPDCKHTWGRVPNESF